MRVTTKVAIKKRVKGVSYKYWDGCYWTFEPSFHPERTIEFQFEMAAAGLSESEVKETIGIEVQVYVESPNHRVMSAYKE
jgi:hypothetical protein